MKKILLLSMGVCMFLSQTMAATVSVQTAQLVAKNFYKGAVPAAGTVTPTLLYTRTESDGTVDYYIFGVAPLTGFVIVSADDILKPVMAYSTESNFDLNFQHTGLRDWTDHAAAHVYSAIQQHMQADASITHQWAMCQAGPYVSASRTAAIGPLLHTTWDQEPNYNALCPYNTTDNQRAVTGCVATTMAQIMKFWGYPNKGTGSHSYQCTSSKGYNYGTLSASFNHTYPWSSMPNNLSGADSNVARLMYDCGVSVEMSYGDNVEGGSGAFVLQSEAWGGGACAENSYKTYFYYNPNTIQGVTQTDYTSAQWFAIMKGEIDAGRPVQYEGDDATQGGHTWVMDGYDANGLMHMNWGWSGSYNGYFTATSLSAGGANFNSREAALIGIQPLFPYTVSIQAPATQVCLGSATQLTAQGPATATYTWSPATGLDCSTCAATGAHPTVNTLYTVTCDSAGVRVPSSVLVTVVPAVKANFSLPSTQACTVPASFTFKNNSSFASTYFWTFGDGTTSTDSAPTHLYSNYGIYDVSLRVVGNCGTDSLIQSQYIGVNNTSPTASGAAICSGGSATLNAVAGGDVVWYSTPTGGSAIATGSSFTTPTLTTGKVYYAEAQILGPQMLAGPADQNFGTGGYYTNAASHGITFNCTSPQVLSYVDVYSQNDGTATVTLSNSTGGTIQSTVIGVSAGYNTVQLNFNIPVGTNMQLSTNGSGAQLYRNRTGSAYPYYSQDSSVVLTGTDAGSAIYYFFYNWQLQAQGCISSRTAVPVYVLNGSNSFSYSSAAGNTVTFTPAVTGATSYEWIFGDGTTSTDQSPVHQYAAVGNYPVKLVVSNGSCTDTVSGTVSSAQGATAIHDIDVIQGMTSYPNPVKDQLDIRVNATQAATVQMAIYDMIGNVISAKDIQLNIGANTMTENVSSYASGVYMIVMQDGHARMTSRFIKD